MKNWLLFFVCIYCCIEVSLGQTKEYSSIDIDEIEVTVQSVESSPKGDTTTVILILQSYLKQNRELKLNTFASGLVSPQGKIMFYSTISCGNVRIDFKDKQNYIHYLLNRDQPVTLVIKTVGWQKRWGKPQQVRLTIEDHLEEGKFLQTDINL